MYQSPTTGANMPTRPLGTGTFIASRKELASWEFRKRYPRSTLRSPLGPILALVGPMSHSTGWGTAIAGGTGVSAWPDRHNKTALLQSSQQADRSARFMSG